MQNLLNLPIVASEHGHRVNNLVTYIHLLMIALFLLLMTWISTVIYFQLGDLISHAFTSKEDRTQAYATIDLAVNSAAGSAAVRLAPHAGWPKCFPP